MITVDLHTHSAASGHGTRETLSDLAKVASLKGIRVLGVTEHGPKTLGSASESYFRSLKLMPKERFGVRMLYGAEVNILEGGVLDLPDIIMKDLDYVIASMHCPPRKVMYRPTSAVARGTFISHDSSDRMELVKRNTADYLAAIHNPYVKVIGHPDNTQFPVDYAQIVQAAAQTGTIIEINESSLMPSGYHKVDGIDIRENYRDLLLLCKANRVPILLSSDSHGSERIGEVDNCLQLVQEVGFPSDLIVNDHLGKLLNQRI